MIAELEKWLAANHPEKIDPFKAVLNPPASKSEIDTLQAALPYPLPAEFLECWEQANGMSKIPDFAPWRTLSSVDIARYHAVMVGQEVFDEFANPYSWREGWIPVASHILGDWLCLIITPNDVLDQQDGDIPYDLNLSGVMFEYRQDQNMVKRASYGMDEWVEFWSESITNFLS